MHQRIGEDFSTPEQTETATWAMLRPSRSRSCALSSHAGRAGSLRLLVPTTNGVRAFGGHLMEVAAHAAAVTVPATRSPLPHSLHARFIRPGTAGYRVTDSRAGA